MIQHPEAKKRIPKPPWLKRRLPTGSAYEKVRKLLEENRLHTVCQEAKCPNIWECFSRQTATFLIMGPRCTRDCGFCSVAHGPLTPPDPGEPFRVAEAVKHLGLQYVVVTSVTRDDLDDGGAGFFSETVNKIHRAAPDAKVEVLIPDFRGNADSLRLILDARISVLNHNLETVPRLYSLARPGADYQQSLELIRRVGRYRPRVPVKSGLMLGLGESTEEILKTLLDLRNAGCNLLTLGQYLQPTSRHLPVERFIPPEEFDRWRRTALEMGFTEAASGPLVRSSYHAKELYLACSQTVSRDGFYGVPFPKEQS
ncbi:MAG TPA: lipoyl synthase [Desulfobacterales bacterium]|nr:lipoyl synthase [Desulfobacterales bacterium]